MSHPLTHSIRPVEPGFGPWAGALDPVERVARLRCMRALAAVHVGFDHELTRALAEGERSRAAATRALVVLEALPALPRRRILASFALLHRPQAGNETGGPLSPPRSAGERPR